ncbi:MAG: DUF697 domain-containing protein [Snowella sp.]|nr:DUF697 domain-containing protein [Snowella sp.]
MAVQVQKPVLVGGLGLCLLLLGWESVHTHLLEMGQWGLWGMTAFGLLFWKLKRSTKSSLAVLTPLTRQTVDTAIAQAQTIIDTLATEAPEQDVTHFRQQLTELPSHFDRQILNIGITGTKGTGKSALKNLLAAKVTTHNVNWQESEPLLIVDNHERSLQNLAKFDLTLFLISGDLTDSEWQTLQNLYRNHHRLLLLFNKQDQYRPEERVEILQKIQHQISPILPESEIFGLSVAPKPLKVRRHLEDGTIEEFFEETKVDLAPLTQHLTSVINQEKADLILGTTWREAQQIKQTAKEQLNQIRRDRALPVIEQYQWIAGGTALINPVASLDLLATAAINGQMVLDLSGIYQQKFSLEQAQSVAAEVGQLIVKLGLVELSTQSLGSLLKTNAVTYVAGGAIQGVSAAYLTRVAGLSLVEYFQAQEISQQTGEGLNLEKLGQTLQQVFAQTQRLSLLQDFAKKAIAALPNSKKMENSIA